MTGERLQFSRLISQLVRKLHLLDRNQKTCYGLTLPQAYTIESLHTAGPLSMKELSRSTGTTISTMTRVVDLLVRDGIVQRGAHPADRRQVLIELTGDGWNLARKLSRCCADYADRLLTLVPADRREPTLKAFGVIINALDQLNASCCRPLKGDTE